jgi:voltage-gated potassium channel
MIHNEISLYKKSKVYIYDVIVKSEGKWSIGWIFDVLLVSLILANVAALILESVQIFHSAYHSFFYTFELISIAFFSVEYILRVWTITENPKYKHPVLGRLKFMFSFMAIIDLLAILPFYLPYTGVDSRFLRILRMFRIVRILKVTGYFNSLLIIANVFQKKKKELIISSIVLALMLLFVSCLMYFVENEAQPDVFTSIPASMWWGIVTLTTVGYGDIFPVTALGKMCGAVVALLGMGFFALPAGILASGFSDEMSELRNSNKQKQENSKMCPHCGEALHE